MAYWTFKCYDDGKPTNLWQRWYDENVAAQGAHDATLDILLQQEVWRGINTKAFDEIVEIKFKGAGIQHRIFGFYGSARQQFIITGTGYHKDKVYYPKEILKTCVKRRREVERDPEKAKVCTRPKISSTPQ